MHTDLHVHACTQTCMSTHAHRPACPRMHTDMHVHACTQTCMSTHAHRPACPCMHTDLHVHACTQTCMSTHAHRNMNQINNLSCLFCKKTQICPVCLSTSMTFSLLKGCQHLRSPDGLSVGTSSSSIHKMCPLTLPKCEDMVLSKYYMRLGDYDQLMD
jgi:hypothetical protein